MKKTVIPCLVAILCSAFFLGSCANQKSEVVGTQSSEVTIVEPEPLKVSITNYFSQPPTDFSLYSKNLDIKGIYVSSSRAGIKKYLEPLIELCNTTEVNAMVIDIKTDDGNVSVVGQIPVADEMNAGVNHIENLRELNDTLNKNNIYSIARIVCFKDNGAVEKRPDMYIKNKDGTIWRDKSYLKSAWLNPYNKDSWDYILDIAVSSAKLGFKEIQFDYIRFDTSKRLDEADFGETNGKSKVDIITEFTEYAVAKLKPYGVKVSADVYGTIINSDIDANIVGQDYTKMASILDVICPMLYPSHYANNSMEIDFPDTRPYDTIFRAMELSNKRLSNIPEGEHKAVVRPWLQDFTATWVKPHITYGAKERRDQIQATYDSGAKEWILWDASVKYDIEGFLPN